jgi:DUF971 family protein
MVCRLAQALLRLYSPSAQIKAAVPHIRRQERNLRRKINLECMASCSNIFSGIRTYLPTYMWQWR